MSRVHPCPRVQLIPSNWSWSLRTAENGLEGVRGRRFSNVLAAPITELAMRERLQTALLKSSPPMVSSPNGVISSSKAVEVVLGDVKTLNMRIGL
eukprot:70726-Pleurochrysis_carterae.AAC.2